MLFLLLLISLRNKHLHKLSIIIPTFNEADNIGKLINYLKKNDVNKLTEIIIADAGSTDNTSEIAIKDGAKVLLCPTKGRAAQMNYGASFAGSDILYFVHADCLPPESFLNEIIHAIQNGFEFGRYRTKFDSNKKILKINGWFTRFDWFICYGGDQTLFITKKLFNRIGGFNCDMMMMEDFDIVQRGKQFAKYRIIEKNVLISARKYDNNSWLKVQLANRTIVNMYKKGAAQNDMVKKYKELLNYR